MIARLYRYKKLFITGALFPIILFAQGSEADFVTIEGFEKVAQTGYQFLKIGVGTRATGMGDAATTISGDADNIFWNPAGIAEIDGSAIFFGYTTWFADIKYMAFSATRNIGKLGVFGLNVVSVDYPSIEGTIINGQNNIGYDDIGDINPVEYAVGISYARGFTDKFSLGGTAKYCSQVLVEEAVAPIDTTYSTDVIAFDFGTLYNTGWNDLMIGMSLQHFAKELRYIEEYFNLPTIFRIGFSVDLLKLLNIESDLHQTTVHFEGANPLDYSERVHIGMEYWYRNMIALRAGYKFNYENEDFTYGTTLRLTGIDVGFAHSDLGSILGRVNRFSIHYEF